MLNMSHGLVLTLLRRFLDYFSKVLLCSWMLLHYVHEHIDKSWKVLSKLFECSGMVVYYVNERLDTSGKVLGYFSNVPRY